MEHYKHYKHFIPFQKNITKITNRTKNCWQSVMRQRNKKLLRQSLVLKKNGTLLTKCHASNIYLTER